MTNFLERLDLRHLAVFQSIAEARSLWKAADRLDLSPSTVSQHLSSLERIVGQRLVDRARGSRHVALTDAGELLLGHADTILARVRAAQSDFEAFGSGTKGPLRVGIYQSIGSRVLPRLLPRFARQWPGIELQLVEGLSDSSLLQMIQNGEIDLTFTTLPVRSGPFEAVRLIDDPYVVAVSIESSLASSQSPISISELGDHRLLGIATCRAELKERFTTIGVQPAVWFPSTDNAVIQSLAATDVGVAIAPLMTFDPSDKRIRLRVLRDVAPRTLGLAWLADRSFLGAAESFRTAAQQVCLELDAEMHPTHGARPDL